MTDFGCRLPASAKSSWVAFATPPRRNSLCHLRGESPRFFIADFPPHSNMTEASRESRACKMNKWVYGFLVGIILLMLSLRGLDWLAPH